MSASSVNQRLSAIRKLAAEAADNGLLDAQIAGGIRTVKGARQEGQRTGNRLTREEAQGCLGAPDRHGAVLGFACLGSVLTGSKLA